MKTYEEIQSKLKCMQGVMALHRLLKKDASRADLMLLGDLITGDPQGDYLVEFDTAKKRVEVTHGWNDEAEVYYTVSSFYMPDVFLGVQQL